MMVKITQKKLRNNDYRPYTDWEDWQCGMYRSVPKSQQAGLVAECAALLANQPRFKAASMRCIDEWPISAATNLKQMDGNRRAWIGQAACCIELKANEEITRLAWSLMSDNDRRCANATADEVIAEYERRFPKCQSDQLELMF